MQHAKIKAFMTTITSYFTTMCDQNTFRGTASMPESPASSASCTDDEIHDMEIIPVFKFTISDKFMFNSTFFANPNPYSK